VKTYGIALKYQSRNYTHNIYKEFRDVTLNGAVSQLHMEMSGNHRTDHSTIQIMRTATLTDSKDIKRAKSL
jgi:large subunit ribosomal protein L18Ae